MSGHSSYTSWINSKAGYLIRYGNKVKIKDTFFTSVAGPHNSDEFNIKLENGKVVGFSDKHVDWDDLRKRHRKSLSPREKKREDKENAEFKNWLRKIRRKSSFVLVKKSKKIRKSDKNGNAKFLKGIDKLNSGTHKVIKTTLKYTREERELREGKTTLFRKKKKTKKPRT